MELYIVAEIAKHLGTVCPIFQCTTMLRQPTEQIRNEVSELVIENDDMQDLQQADARVTPGYGAACGRWMVQEPSFRLVRWR